MLLKRYLTCVVLLVLAVCLFVPDSGQVLAQSINTLKEKQNIKKQELYRIQRLKQQIRQKEQYVTDNLVRNQQKLDTTQKSLEMEQERLEALKGDMSVLEGELDVAMAEYKTISDKVGDRVRRFYMDERMTHLHMLLDAGNISTLLDRIYYKQRLMDEDKRLFTIYLDKVQVLESKKKELATRKQELADTISAIETYQSQLQEAMELDRLMVSKLKTSLQAYENAQRQLERESLEIEQQILDSIARSGGELRTAGRFIAPVLARITSNFGYRYHPIFKTRKLHSGTDFGAGYGTPVKAAGTGRVIYSGWKGGYGRVVIINHGTFKGKNITTLYGHLSRQLVSPNQMVSSGQVIGNVGSTGYSTGPHLHFEVRENGRTVNPMGYLK